MSYYPELKQIEELVKGGTYKSIPISLAIEFDKSVKQIYKILKNVSKNVFVLESCYDKEQSGRYSFLGFDPSLEFLCKDHRVTLKSSTTITIDNANPQEYIRKILVEHKSPVLSGLPPFTGGLVGYFSYDYIKYNEPKIKLNAKNDEGFQDVDLMLFEKIIALDHKENKIILIVTIPIENIETTYNKGILELENLKNLLVTGKEKEEEDGRILESLVPSFSRKEYSEMVKTAKKHIYEGDIFQVVLSNRLSAPYKGSMYHIYEKLKARNPSPYMFYFSSDNIEMAGASPETLVKLEGKKVMTYPLAGTRKRGKTLEENMRLEQDLLSDEKERAEHNMLVDLGRNDVGKISKFGSVKVESYMNVLHFSHVMHIGSTVVGEIAENKDAIDAIDAVLPAGTLSGAPKIKACEIIDNLEGLKRGVYGGAIGYLDFNGNMDTCIAIRFAFKKNDKIFVRSGAGIVADSVPEKEYEECINKARATVKVLEEKNYDIND